MSRMIDANALFAIVKRHHDLYKGATNPADKARRDECLQVMCDINDAPTVDAIPMEWLEKKLHEGYHRMCTKAVLDMWQKEQEAQDG